MNTNPNELERIEKELDIKPFNDNVLEWDNHVVLTTDNDGHLWLQLSSDGLEYIDEWKDGADFADEHLTYAFEDLLGNSEIDVFEPIELSLVQQMYLASDFATSYDGNFNPLYIDKFTITHELYMCDDGKYHIKPYTRIWQWQGEQGTLYKTLLTLGRAQLHLTTTHPEASITVCHCATCESKRG